MIRTTPTKLNISNFMLERDVEKKKYQKSIEHSFPSMTIYTYGLLCWLKIENFIALKFVRFYVLSET